LTITRSTLLADLPELLRVEEFATWAGVGKGTAYEAIRSGELPSVRIGRLVRIPRAGVAEWMGVQEPNSD
jgi:excisionase family DNA binding protein